MRKPLILPLLLLSTFLAVSLNNQIFESANASFNTKNVIDEKFDGDIEDSWNLINEASLEKQYSSLRLKPQAYSWSNSLSLNYQLSGSFKVKMELTTMNETGWFAVSFGSIYASSEFSKSKGGLAFFGDTSQVLKRVGEDLKNVEFTGTAIFAPELNVKRQVEFDVQQIDSEHSSLQVSVYERGQFVTNIFETPYVYENLNGYMSFNSSLKDIEIFKLEVLDGQNQRLYYDDFSTSKVLYPTSGTIDSEWYSNGFTVEELKVGYINYLLLGHVNDGIVYHDPLEKTNNPDLDVVYHLVAEVDYSAMDLDVESGIEIGKANKDSHGYFFGIRRMAIGYSLVMYQYDSSEEYTLQTYDESSLRMNLELSIHNNGNIDFTIGELSHTINYPNYNGYFGLFNYSHSHSTSSRGASIFSFSMNKTGYYDRSSGDIYMNFNGTKKTYFEDIDEYAYDYFISRSEWNIGTRVSPSKWRTKDQGNGKLEFNSAVGTSIFGPKVVLKEFVVKFDVEITSEIVPYGGVLGLEFGNSRMGLNYENTKSLGIGYYPDENHEYVTVAYASNTDLVEKDDARICTDEEGHRDIFKNNGKFTMMFICRNNTVSMHYLLDGEPEHTLGKIRAATICKENDSTDGYLAIYGANGISFTVDNLSIINLDFAAKSASYNGKGEYQEVTRVDFSKEDANSGISYQNASVNDGKLKINDGGSLRTLKLTNDGIIRLAINDVEEELVIKQGSLNIRFINKADKSIIVSDSVSEQTYDLGSEFDFRQSIIEIQKLNNHLVFRLKDKNTPLSSIENHKVEFTINTSSTDNLIIEAKGGFVSLNGFTFINLNKYVTISNRDYDPEKDSFAPWTPKTPINGDKKKGSNNLNIIIPLSIAGGVLVVVGIVVAIIFIVRRKKHA